MALETIRKRNDGSVAQNDALIPADIRLGWFKNVYRAPVIIKKSVELYNIK